MDYLDGEDDGSPPENCFGERSAVDQVPHLPLGTWSLAARTGAPADSETLKKFKHTFSV